MTRGDTRLLVVIAQPDVAEVDEFVALFDSESAIAVDVIVTESPDDVDAAVAEAAKRGADAIASVGGDGAINLVASALVRAGSDMTLAPVPAGTVNLATQVVGLDDAGATADAVIADRSRVIDVGETDQGVFVLNASTGFDASVIDDADDHSDARFGRLRFLRSGVRRLRRQTGERVRVEVDGGVVFDGRAMSVIVMNVGQRVSDSLYVAPDAEPDDGLLDVAVVRVDTVRRMAATVWRLVRRRNVPDRDVVRAQGVSIRVDWWTEVASQRDGDADDPVRSLAATCRPGVLRIHHG
ncbi:MAG: diacylglycerol kinase family protein [Ilumatobacter sp.]|uniref:diacylglycerol/lipid kinase family protein n=2 Tax=Ilumatobacter sp. TaxID=1967498 RepID=UPI003296D273